MRKNLLGFALLIALLTILLTFSVSAADPKVSISNATVEAGSTVSVNVTLEDNPGLIVLKARIKYNDTYFSVPAEAVILVPVSGTLQDASTETAVIPARRSESLFVKPMVLFSVNVYNFTKYSIPYLLY